MATKSFASSSKQSTEHNVSNSGGFGPALLLVENLEHVILPGPLKSHLLMGPALSVSPPKTQFQLFHVPLCSAPKKPKVVPPVPRC
ncbi:unnamed protein product [Linum trigynum]|uniref:Uncharacterized protein n=1 Tax=Linum trigynum TaxID=586398 RepID=A0AAV2EYH3_9ROSI